MTKYFLTQKCLTLATSWMTVVTLKRVTTSCLSQQVTKFFPSLLQRTRCFGGGGGGGGDQLELLIKFPLRGWLDCSFPILRCRNCNAHTLSLLIIYALYCSKLPKLWKDDPILSNSEIKFELGAENIREEHLIHKEPCVVKLETSRCVEDWWRCS